MSDVPHLNEPDPAGDLSPPSKALEPAPDAHLTRTAVTHIPGLEPWLYAIGAALVAGFLAWGIGEKTHDYYRPRVQAQQDARDLRALNRALRIADQKNTAIVSAAFGAVLGLLSGAAGGALRRSIGSGVSAALLGLLLGGVGGALVSYELAPVFDRFYSDESPSLVLSILVRGGIWAVVGMAAGLALGLGWRGFRGIPGILLGGLAGSVCGTIAFEVVNALLWPADRNDAVIPSSMQARLLACLLVSAGVALFAVFFGRHRSWPAGRTPEAQA